MIELQNCVYRNAVEHGFHDKNFNDDHYKALIVSEAAEALEADRKGKKASLHMFESQPQDNFDNNFILWIKDSVEDELADVCIRLMDFAGMKDITLTEPHLEYDTIEQSDFSEQIFWMIKPLFSHDSLELQIQETLKRTKYVAAINGIDIQRHIQLKHRYNIGRPRLHGKMY